MNDEDVTVHLPTLLAECCGGRRRFVARRGTLRAVLEDLFRQAPALKVHVLDEAGQIRRHVLCYVGNKDSRWLQGLDTPVPASVEVTIVQAVSGG